MSYVHIGESNGLAIRAILLKVERAYDQTKLLASLQTEYVEAKPRPYRVDPSIQSNLAEHIFRLRFDSPIPLDFSILFGEIIYNLRSAIDQCVFQLALDKTGVEHDKTMFPIFKDPGEFRRFGEWRIKDIGDGPKAFIKSLQPYSDRSLPVHDSLLDLNNLSNADKHRVAHLWGFSFGLNETKVATGATVIPTGINKVLHDGAEICRVIPKFPTDKMQVRGSLLAVLTVANPVPDRRVSINLWNIVADVRCLVYALLGALGQQDEPIEVEWPPHEVLG